MEYIDAGITGAELRRILNNGQASFIDPKDFGALGDGLTDDIAAFRLAISYMAANGGAIRISEGHYVLNDGIDCQLFSQLKGCYIEGVGNVVLDFSGMTNAIEAFDLGSTKSSDYTFTTNLVKGATTIESLLPVAEGDVISIISTDLWGGTAAAGTVKRELVVVKSVLNGVITLNTPLMDDYDKTTTVIFNTNSAKVSIRNIKLKGNLSVNAYAIALKYFNTIAIEDVDISDFSTTGIGLSSCIGGTIKNSRIYNCNRSGFGYGVSLSNCNNIEISSCSFMDNIFGVTMGTNTKNSTVSNCHVSPFASSTNCLDNHPACEFITFKDNFLNGGILLKGINNSIINNTIFATKACVGIELQSYGYGTKINEYVNITDNRIIQVGTGQVTGIYIQFDGNGDYHKNINISNNIIKTNHYCFSAYINSAELVDNHIGNLIFSNNIFETTAVDKSCVYVHSGILLDFLKINGGKLTSGAYGIIIIGADNSGTLDVDSVFIDAASNPLHTYTSKLTNTFIRNCHLKGGGYLNLLASSNIILQNNTLENMIKGGIKITTGTAVYTHGGNVRINCTGDVENAATATNDGTDY